MRHGEATFGRHGIKTSRQFAGETYREVSVLTDVHLRQIFWPVLPRANGSPSASPSLPSTLPFNCVCDGDRDVHRCHPRRHSAAAF